MPITFFVALPRQNIPIVARRWWVKLQSKSVINKRLNLGLLPEVLAAWLAAGVSAGRCGERWTLSIIWSILRHCNGGCGKWDYGNEGIISERQHWTDEWLDTTVIRKTKIALEISVLWMKLQSDQLTSRIPQLKCVKVMNIALTIFVIKNENEREMDEKRRIKCLREQHFCHSLSLLISKMVLKFLTHAIVVHRFWLKQKNLALNHTAWHWSK